MNTENHDRNHAIWVDRENGMTFGALSIKYHLSKQRIIDIYTREKEINESSGASFAAALRECGCSESGITRIIRSLSSAGIPVDALDEVSDSILKSLPGIGEKSIRFIRNAYEKAIEL